LCTETKPFVNGHLALKVEWFFFQISTVRTFLNWHNSLALPQKQQNNKRKGIKKKKKPWKLCLQNQWILFIQLIHSCFHNTMFPEVAVPPLPKYHRSRRTLTYIICPDDRLTAERSSLQLLIIIISNLTSINLFNTKPLYFTFPNDVTPQFLKKLDTSFVWKCCSPIKQDHLSPTHYSVTNISEQALEIETSVPPTNK